MVSVSIPTTVNIVEEGDLVTVCTTLSAEETAQRPATVHLTTSNNGDTAIG